MCKNRASKTALFLTLMSSYAPQAQTLTVLAIFTGANGGYPAGTLVQGTDGNFYGVTRYGGANLCPGSQQPGCGTIFKTTPAGGLTTLHSFNGADGEEPFAGLIQATDGNLYGTTRYGGANGYGSIFRINLDGKLTSLHSFSNTDGAYPEAALLQAVDGSLYGTTFSGGSDTSCNCGTVFKATTTGSFTTLHSFDGADGYTPTNVALVQTPNGSIYGETASGGSHNRGNIFAINSAGAFTQFYTFFATKNGNGPDALVYGGDGNFYGTTAVTGGRGTIIPTFFQVTPAKTLTTLHTFYNNFLPVALIQGSDGRFYGEASPSLDIIFSIDAQGDSLTTLYSFPSNCSLGCYPQGLVQGTDGNLYGLMFEGGGVNNQGLGTSFSLSTGLSPFVKSLPISGKAGANIKILGTNLTGATSVSFNGTPTAFTVVSPAEITATVPAGATTGNLQVITATSTLSSDVAFRVRPVISTFSPTSGHAGTTVTITGVSLTQATQISFGGVAATSITVNSDTQVTATEPPTAKTGRIGITTLGGVTTSTGTFTVN